MSDMATEPVPPRPRVVIIGGGFAGLTAAKHFRRAAVDVTVVDSTNHHIFQPLLYQVATATLAPSDITVPIRWVLRKQKNTTVLMATADRVDVDRRVVILDMGAIELPYDYLIVATGSRHSYFGHDEWEADAPGLKSIADAYDMRRRFLIAFELAEKEHDPAERAALQTFVVIGGGPTGVELAGVLPDTAKHALHEDFRHIDTRQTRVVLLEGGPRLLPSFPEKLSAVARRDLEQLGVEVRTNSIVTRVEPDAVYVGDERIATRTIFWAAGNAASPLGRSLGAPLDRAGRVQVTPDLSIPAHPEVFVCGDLAAVPLDAGDAPATPAGRPPAPPRLVPGVAPAANQMGALAAKNILARIAGQPTRPFRYFDKGNLATIGRHRAVADFGRFRMTGHLAWWTWLFVHLLYLVGFRNRLSVLIQWAYAYFTYQRGVRLISEARPPATSHAPIAVASSSTVSGSTVSPSQPIPVSRPAPAVAASVPQAPR